MLLVPFIRENKNLVIERLKVRNIDATTTIERILSLDQERKQTQQALDTRLSEMNTMSKTIGDLFKSGQREEAEVLRKEVADRKDQTTSMRQEMVAIEDKLKHELYQIPNIPHPSVPAGKSDADNEVITEHGAIPDLGSNNKPHWELADQYKLIDFELGNKITGAGFPVYTGKGARLQRALINFFLDEADKAGYREVIPPLLVNEDSGYGTGQLPDKEGQMYHATEDDLYLIPTAEVPITNMYRDVILKEENFPIKNCGYTPCFRREAGSYGKDVRGLNRLHQFDKVEIIQIQHPDKSYEALDEMVAHVQGLLEKLELPFRILRLCGGDLGFTAALTFDMEVYSAAQERWLEVSSISNVETYQANRLKCRYKGENGTQLVHTLNGSALALPRIVAALLENNQQADGIHIPAVLRPYTGFDKIDQLKP